MWSRIGISDYLLRSAGVGRCFEDFHSSNEAFGWETHDIHHQVLGLNDLKTSEVFARSRVWLGESRFVAERLKGEAVN